MANYLMREAAPLTEAEWSRLDGLVTDVAKRLLVGRRVVPLFGPLGPAVQTVPITTYGAIKPQTGGDPVREEARSYVVPAELHKDFVLNWRDIELGRSGQIPLEMSAGAAAAAVVAWAEDSLILKGSRDAEGVMGAKGRLKVAMSDWSTKGAFGDVTAALQKLQEAGFPDRYALVVSPIGYAQMQCPYGNTGALEISLIRELCPDGVYQTPVLDPSEAVLIATGPQNVDLAVGVDLSVGYLDNIDMDHRFRVFETIALRIKRPRAICTITK